MPNDVIPTIPNTGAHTRCLLRYTRGAKTSVRHRINSTRIARNNIAAGTYSALVHGVLSAIYLIIMVVITFRYFHRCPILRCAA